jgi:hypothetical protein
VKGARRDQNGGVPPDQLSRVARVELQEVVFRFIGLVEDYRQRRYPRQQPEPGSTAASEVDELDNSLAERWSDEPVRLGLAAAELHLRSSQDQVGGLGILLGSNLQDSLMTVARGATEAAARASWLLDSSIDGRQRIARTMTERLAALHQESHLDDQIGRTLDAAGRIEAITTSAHMKSFDVRSGARGRLHVGSEEHPGPTRAITLLFQDISPDFGVRAYADLSAVAHSTLAAFAARRPLAEPDSPDPHPAPSPNPPSEQELPVERGAVIALAAYERAVRRYFELFGWSVAPFDGFVREAHARIRTIIGVPPGLVDIVRVGRQ